MNMGPGPRDLIPWNPATWDQRPPQKLKVGSRIRPRFKRETKGPSSPPVPLKV